MSNAGRAVSCPTNPLSFNKYYADYVHKTKSHHAPGTQARRDHAGGLGRPDAALVTQDTGERLDAYLFVAVLPYSGYAYTEGLSGHEAGGLDHRSCQRPTGIRRRPPASLTRQPQDRYCQELPYRDCASTNPTKKWRSTTATAILPARPRSPKDKAFVEGSVGVVSTWILAALRNRQFLSLMELNEAIHEKLETFNHKSFQKREGSRAACFAEEKLFLLPLPAMPFELAVWKVATVQYNYHISVERMNYSVPYEYIKQQVDVRLTRTTVEIFFAGTRIASHLRLHGPSQPVQHGGGPYAAGYAALDCAMEWRAFYPLGRANRPAHRCRGTAFPLRPQGGATGLQVLYGPAETGGPLFRSTAGERPARKVLSYTVSPSLKSVQSILKSRAGQAAR